MKIKSVRHNMIMNFILAASGVVIPLITYPYVTRVLSANGLGKVSFASNVIFYYKLIAQLGVPTYGISQCAKAREDKEALSKITTQLTAINMITVGISIVGLCISILLIPTLNNYALLLAINSFDIIFGTLNYEWLYKGLEQFDYITKRSLICRMLTMGLTFVLIQDERDFYLYAFLSVISSMLIFLLNIRNIREMIFIRKKYLIKEEILKHIKPILILCATSLTTTIYTSIDILMIGFLCGDNETGIYSVAIKIKTILVTVMTSIVAVYLPRMSQYYKDKDMERFNITFSRSMQFVIMLSLPIILFFMETASLCIRIIGGEGYLAAVMPMKILMPTILLIGCSSMVGTQVMVAIGRQKYQLRSAIIAAIADIIINLSLITQIGAIGAAIGTLAAEALVLILEIVFIRDVFKQIIKKIHIGKSVISAIITNIITHWMQGKTMELDINIIVKFLILAITYGVLYISIMILLKDGLFLEIVGSVQKILRRKR